jgi:hypothetical protein
LYHNFKLATLIAQISPEPSATFCTGDLQDGNFFDFILFSIPSSAKTLLTSFNVPRLLKSAACCQQMTNSQVMW